MSTVVAGQPAPPVSDVAPKNKPPFTVAWIFATAAALLYVLAALLPERPSALIAMTDAEYEELRKFTIFFITALLPSDALIRFGRNLLFRSIKNPKEAAADAPRYTLPQALAFVAFLAILAAAVLSDTFVDSVEFANINDVLRTLVVALLPSEALIRVGRALYLRGSDTVTKDQAERV
jgi:hypothetical protein